MNEIHVHVHIHSAALESIELKIDKLLEQQEKMMATVEELKSELAEINATTDELAADVAELVSKIPDGAGLDEVKAGLVAVKDRLKGVAASYPVVNPPPPVDPATGRRR